MPKNPEKKESDNLQETPSQRILLEEYRLLQNRYLNLQDEGVTRLNFFITATSVSIGSLLVFGGSSNFPLLYFKIALLVITGILSVINHYICKFYVHRDTVIDRYDRGLARIRHYFIKMDPALADYFITRTTDIPTGNIVKNTSGMRRAAQLLESFLLGLAATILTTFTTLSAGIDILIGCVAAVFVYLSLEITAQRKYKAAIQTAEKDRKF